MLSGTIMKTSGSVQGKTIIDRPATYAIIIQERYDVLFCPSTTNSLVSEKTMPMKINDINANDAITTDFLAAIWSDND